MAIDKLIPRYLNKDDDYLLVKSVEMVDALNVQMSDDEGGNAGVIKNALGNVLVSSNTSGDVLPTGTNTVIGTTACKQTGEIFYFVHNSSNNHSIYQYTSKRNTVRLVYSDPVLGFTATGFVKADCLVKENGDTLLYFTDGVTDPKKINATRALANTAGVSGYPYKAAGATGYTNDEKLLSITTIKAPPLEPLSIALAIDSNINSNYLKEDFFQFAYQYVYEDGEISALSPHSDISINTYSVLDGIDESKYIEKFNAIDVYFKYSKGDVSKIRIFSKSKNQTNFCFFKEIDNNRAISTGSVRFFNSNLLNPLSDNENNKLFDNVPLKSQSQVISGNRLSYGNYTEFFDIPDKVSGNVLFNFEDVLKIPSIISSYETATGVTVTGGTVSTNWKISLDFNKAPASSRKAITIPLSISLKASKYLIEKIYNPGIPPSATDYNFGYAIASSITLGEIDIPIQKTISLPSGYATLNALASSINSAISGTYIGTTSSNNSNLLAVSGITGQGQPVSGLTFSLNGTIGVTIGSGTISSGVLTMDVRTSSLNIQSNSVVDASGTYNNGFPADYTLTFPPLIWSFPDSIATTSGLTFQGIFNSTLNNYKLIGPSSTVFTTFVNNKTFKSGQFHKFGVVYYDNYNRSSSVNPLDSYYVETEGERGDAPFGPSKAIIRLSNQPPSWAKKYQIVYSPYSTYSFAYRYSVAEGMLASSTSSTVGRNIFLSMRHLEGQDSSYKESKGAIFNYSFAKGDKLRIVSYTDPLNGKIYYPRNYIFDIISYDYYTSQDTPINTTTYGGGRAIGWIMSVKDEGYLLFSSSDITSNNSRWPNDCIVEIYRPVRSVSTPVYNEIGLYGDVSSTVGGIRYHKTNFRDRSYTSAGSQSLVALNGLFTISSGFTQIYPGDRIEFTQRVTPPNTPLIAIRTVESTYVNTSGNLVVTFTQNNALIDSTWDFNYSNITGTTDSIIVTSNGDCYSRPRQIKLNPFVSGGPNVDPSDVSNIRYSTLYVEDLSVSDFYESNYLGFGRPNAESLNVKQIERKSSITYSEPYSLDSSVLKLSSFNGGQGNFVDLPNAYGAIKQMLNNGDSVTVLQEVKSSLIPINRNLVEYLDGTSNVTVSTNFLGTQSVYAGNYGTQNPESVKEHNGRIYFSDVRSGKIVRIGPDGLEPISEAKIDAYTQDKCFIIASSTGTYKTIGGIDPMHGEYDITYLNVNSSGDTFNDTIAYDMEDKVWNTRYSFKPEAYEHLDNFLYTFKGGAMYRHTDAAPRNTFYGNESASSIKLISAFNNSMVKTAEAFSIEGNSPWSFKFSLSGQTARETMTVDNLSLREGMYYASVPRLNAASNQAVSNRAVIGYITATGTWASGVTLTIGNPITTPFQVSGNTFIGALTSSTTMTIYNGVTGYSTIQASGTNTILLSNLSGSIATIPTGTILVADSPAFIDGDPVRGPFFIIDVTKSATTPIEAYAFNVYFTRSRLHNELVTE